MRACKRGGGRGYIRWQARGSNGRRWACVLILHVIAFCFLGLFDETEAGTVESTEPSISQILHGVQQRYGGAAFEADFSQESHMDAMGIVDTALGHVYFKAPFRMRWHYKDPEEYVIVTDGETVWIYRFVENQVMVGKAADYFGDTTFTEFFVEPAKLQGRFTIEMAFPKQQETTGDHVLRLVPRDHAMNVREIFLSISKTTYDIVQSDTYNAFGDKTRLKFFNFKIGEGIDDSLFRFNIPKNAEVMELDRP